MSSHSPSHVLLQATPAARDARTPNDVNSSLGRLWLARAHHYPPLLWLPQRPHAPGEARDGRLSRRVTSRIRFDPRLQLPNRSQDRLLLQRRQRGQLGRQLCVERDVRVMLPPATFRPNQVLLAP